MNKQDVTIFDYIIIGGGSAGCVLANRLSAKPDLSICLLEAGPRDSNPFIRMPLGILAVIRSKTLNWKFWTSQQIYCANRSIYWPRGRTLGGSSAINAMCYIRGNPLDYDQWAKLGNTGWSYQDVLPYFKKLENFELGENSYHHIGGPLNVAAHRYINPLMPIFIEAAQQAGHAFISDFNGETQEGVSYYQVTQVNGQRCSNATAYLHPIEHRRNLNVVTNAQATHILFENKRAIGVRYFKNYHPVVIYARKEVILSAGAIGSPHLLLLSGVGPSDEIKKHGIPLVHHLPGVGENLQDHLDIHITCIEKTRYAFSFHFTAIFRLIKNFLSYVLKHQGELTINYTQAGGLFKTDPGQAIPNMQWHFAPSVFTNSGLHVLPLIKYYGYTLMTSYLHPKSRGRISLRSADPHTPPLIDPNYLAHEADLDALVTGFKMSRQLLAQPAFSAHFSSELEPGLRVQTDEQIKEYIRHHAETIYHPVGTCKMGCDKDAVVDSKLRVHGLTALRVIDASVMPVIVSGNTNTATTMIAEKGADLILKQEITKQ